MLLQGTYLEERAQHEPALDAVELDLLQLGEDARAAGHHPTRLDQAVQMQLPGHTATRVRDKEMPLSSGLYSRSARQNSGFCICACL
jgi:hypothetical protein